MSFDLALNRRDHDLMLEKGSDGLHSFRLIDKQDVTAQAIKMTLLTFLGEWFLDTTVGVPYLEDILVKNPNLNTISSIIRDKILSVEGVVRITSFSMDWNRAERRLLITYGCDTLDGPVADSYPLDMLRG